MYNSTTLFYYSLLLCCVYSMPGYTLSIKLLSGACKSRGSISHTLVSCALDQGHA